VDRVFLDANVLVSAALRPGSRLHELWDAGGIRLLASPHVVAEARRNVHGDAAARLEDLLEAVAVLPAEPAPFEIDAQLPPKDVPVLLGAIVAKADYLLTGDMRHFGALLGTEVQGVQVELPGTYVRMLYSP
jgi:predicted nucleic acid-binding protein